MNMKGNFDNTGRLVRFILRRERIISTVWIVILVLFSMALAPGIDNMFDNKARLSLADTLQNPGMIAMMGPTYGYAEGDYEKYMSYMDEYMSRFDGSEDLDKYLEGYNEYVGGFFESGYTVGAMYGGLMLIWVAIAAAVMNIFLAVRHTRADEEKGRIEVVRSLPTGRLANLTATMIAAVVINFILAVTMGLGLAVTGVESMPFAGCMLYGAAVGVFGLLFAAITVLFCQLCYSSRGAVAYSFITLGVCYMLRAVGDMGNEALSLISSMGLIMSSQTFVENNLLPLVIILLQVIALTVVACVLNSIRDIEQGFIPARPGRKEASPLLRSPFGLAFRLLRNTLIAWLIVMFLLGASYGSVFGDIEGFISDSPTYQQIMGLSEDMAVGITGAEYKEMILNLFVSMVFSMMTLICIVPAINAAMKPRGEEKDGRIEHMLSRVVSRTKLISGYTIIAFIASVLIQLSVAAGLYISAAAVLEKPLPFGDLIISAGVYLPALWVMIGLTIFLTGLFPKATGAIWGYYGFVCFASFIGRILNLPDWLQKLAPIYHIPQEFPLVDINFTPLVIMTVLAVVLTAAGFVFYTKRDTQA